MDDVLKALLEASARYGAGYLIAGLAIFLYAIERRDFVRERKEHIKTLEKIADLSAASISADKDTTAALATLTRVLDSIERRLESDPGQERRRLG